MAVTLKRALWILALLGVLAGVFIWRQEPTREMPAWAGADLQRGPRSVLVVTVDTTRADHLQPYGATNVATPTFQGLAQQGILFQHAYSVSPITLVAHTSIFSGLYPPQHGVRNNGIHYVAEETATLAERLSAEGYRTAAFVSAAVLEKRYGLDQGFELYDDDLSRGGNRRSPRMVPDRPAGVTVDAAVQWLDGLGSDEKFFVWVHCYDPHAAYSPPPPFRDQYRERLYDGEIAYMDQQIGRLLQHPRLRGDQDLVITVLGDHGESLGEHGEQTHAILAYDSTLRVPWILKISGGPQGIAFNEPVSQVDLVPTLLDILGLVPEHELPGRSALQVGSGSIRDRPILYSETYLPYYTYGWAKLKVLRRGFQKYIEAPTPELYDLKRDPYELSSQIDLSSGEAHDMARDLREFLAELGDSEREVTLALDSEAADKLRSLGYLAVSSSAPEQQARPDPKDVVDLHVGLERSRQLIRDRLFPQAEGQLRAVLHRDPNNLAALVELASAYDLQGKTEEGVTVVQQGLGLDPNNPRLHLQLAGFEAERGNREQAVRLCDAALELDPRFIEAKIQKGIYLHQMRDFSASQEVLEKALEEHPDHPRLNAFYARIVEVRAGELEAARSRLEAALARDPYLVAGYRILGEVLNRLGDARGAVAVYQAGLEHTPDDPELHARLGLLLADLGGGAETERHLNEAIRLSPEFRADLHAARGGWLAEQGRLEEAQKEYQRVLEVQPDHPGARNNRAVAHYQTGRQDEAVAELEAVIAQFPEHADSYNNLAAIAIHRREWKTAERRARQALQHDPKMAEAWNNLGVGLEEQQDLTAAESAYRKALELSEGYWQARFNLGVLLRKSRREREAEAAFLKVLEVVPTMSEAHLELGDLYAGPLQDPNAARNHWNAVLRSAPGHPRAEEIRRRLVDTAGPGSGP